MMKKTCLIGPPRRNGVPAGARTKLTGINWRLARAVKRRIWRSLGSGRTPARPELSTAVPGWDSRLLSFVVYGLGPLRFGPEPNPLPAIHIKSLRVACTSAGYA